MSEPLPTVQAYLIKGYKLSAHADPGGPIYAHIESFDGNCGHTNFAPTLDEALTGLEEYLRDDFPLTL